ncbi:sugar phosphate nucleotidyltransferase [Aeoliella mucimassa]|uniref:MobA-like NTP transferase domain protein n=1 Tax=Aeoliella mucimassa TaxID=2527972 RepID=A0A518AM08_9BACT|nr:sugar phosphate nucleotidyltransferase [Aeoliella mucimassa]QDU55765.1 MobA-like NTP transferase domain protein [Aeoliella mucimassa]
MSTSPTLIIMAAGAARRYGGLKQLAPVGPTGEAIMEYSVYDALQAGFDKVVLVVRREFEQAFRDKWVDRVAGKAEVAFAFQEPDAFMPADTEVPERPKPWGTAHAVLCAKPGVEGAFAVINADDFYGPGAFQAMGEFLASPEANTGSTAAMVGYQLEKTLSDHGTVNRGVCEAENGKLVDIVERFNIARAGDAAESELANGGKLALGYDTIVSMNLWGYPAVMMDYLQAGFHQFVASKPEPTVEFELPTFTKLLMGEGKLSVNVLPTTEQWCGMTYQEDLPIAQARLKELVAAGVYPDPLWQ